MNNEEIIFDGNFYSVDAEENLSFERLQMLNYFYQPLLSKEGFLLYNFLWNEKIFVRNVEKYLQFSRFQFFLKFSDQLLKKTIIELQNFNLLKIKNFQDFDHETKKYLFFLEKPLLSSSFLKSKFFSQFKAKINQVFDEKEGNTFIDQIYYFFRPLSNHKNDEINFEEQNDVHNQHDHKWISSFFSNSKILFSYYQNLKTKDIDLIIDLNQKLKINDQNIKLILEFSVLKIEKFSCKYIEKLIDTLIKKNILFDTKEIKNYFQTLYENFNWKESIKFKNWLPQEKKDQNNFRYISNIDNQKSILLNSQEKNEIVNHDNNKKTYNNYDYLKKIFQ